MIKELRPLILTLIFQTFLLFVLRLIFLIVFWSDFASMRGTDLFYAFYLGGKFDLRIAIILSLPPLIHFLLSPKNFQNQRAQKLWATLSALAWSFVFTFYALDFGHYAYLNSRVGGTVIKFLENPAISAQMVWESYPVFKGAMLIVLLSLGIFFFCRRFIFISEKSLTPAKKQRLQAAGFFFICAALFYGKLSAYPLRWSEAFFSTHRPLSHLALNPITYFSETLAFRAVDYDEKKAQEYYPDLMSYLNIPNSKDARPFYLRTMSPVGKISGRPNVVILVMESMAAFQSGIFGCEHQATPALDQLAKESLLFRRYYVPSIATARSMFATVTGLADVSMVKTSSRNPLVIEQNVPMNYLTDYKKFYFLGGSSNWGQMVGLFSFNVKDVEIMDEAKLKGPRADVWGLSDYHLFQAANQNLAKVQEPFVAIIQSAGYHRPYTIPKDHGDFELKTLSEEQLDQCDFGSNQAYNSLRFQDYALGQFFKWAKSEKYYDNTLFFIYGDHGLQASRSRTITEGQRLLAYGNYHVPFLIHGPKYISASENKQVASQLDLWPTIMGLLGRSYHYRGPGRDLLDPKFDHERGAFTFGWFENPPQIGFFDDEFYFFRQTTGKESLHRYLASDGEKDVSTQYPEIFQKLSRRAHGIYEMSRYLLYNNPRIQNPQIQNASLK